MEYQSPLRAKSLSIPLDRFTVVSGNRGSNRGDLIGDFLIRLNKARVAKGYKPYTAQRLAVLLAHIPTEDLHPFYKQCEQAKIPFGAYFHWALKPRK